MTRATAVALAATFAGLARIAAPLAAQEPTPPPLPSLSAGRVAAQLTLGALAEPVGFVSGGLAFRAVARGFGADEDQGSRVGDVGAALGTSVAAGSVAALIGARGPGHGRYLAGVGGALVGTGVSGILILVNRKTDVEPGKPCHLACILVTSAIATLPSIGATIAYDASRRR